jgi:nucleoside-diphosphate kinase
MERTLIILKPDAVKRRLAGRIITRIEEKGLKIVALKMMQISRKLAEKHYEVHRGKAFYKPLVQFITSAPVIVMVAEGPRAVSVLRKMMGKTFGFEAEPGTIRGDFGVSTQFNLIHGSDSEETAKREISLFFKNSEIFSYDMPDQQYLNLE